METVQARALVTTLIVAYPQAVIEPPTVELYVAALAELDRADIAAETVKATIKASPRFPPISDLIWTYTQIRNRPTGVRQIEEAVVPPPPEAAEAIRKLGEKWKVPSLVEFAERYITSDEEAKMESS